MSKKTKRFIFSCILIIFLLCFVNIYAYGKVSENRNSEQLDLGYKYLSELNYEQAEATFENIISIAENDYEAYLGLAEVYYAMDEPEKADEIMKEAAEKCGYGEIQSKVIEAESGLRQFRSMAGYNSGFEAVSGLTDFCIQGLDIFLDWIEKAATVIDSISSLWRDLIQE